MNFRSVKIIGVVLLVTFILPEIAVSLDVHHKVVKKGSKKIPASKSPSEDGNTWDSANPTIDPNDGNVEVETKPGDKLFFAFDNNSIIDNHKWLKLKIALIDGDFEYKYDYLAAKGHDERNRRQSTSKAPDTKKRRDKDDNRAKTEEDGQTYYHYWFKWNEQPLWEHVVFERTKRYMAEKETHKLIVFAHSVCGEPKPPITQDIIDVRNGSIGAQGAGGQDSKFTVLQYFPHNQDVNTAAIADFNAPGAGNWSYEYVTVDPDGDVRPNGGVKFYTTDGGLKVGQEFDFSFQTIENEILYWFYAYDVNSDTWITSWLYNGPIPTVELIECVSGHGGTEYGIPIAFDGPDNVEPRLGGISKIRITFGQPMDYGTTTDINNITISTYDGDPNLVITIANLSLSGPNNTVLTITPNDVLPDANCYQINFTGMETTYGVEMGVSLFSIRTLLADVTRDGIVDEADINEILQHAETPADLNNARFDINGDGFINAFDWSFVVENQGNTVNECLHACGSIFQPYPLSDLNEDCFVNAIDFAIVAQYWGAVDCNDSNQSNWCGGADLDESGDVALTDIKIMGEWWLAAGLQ